MLSFLLVYLLIGICIASYTIVKDSISWGIDPKLEDFAGIVVFWPLFILLRTLVHVFLG